MGGHFSKSYNLLTGDYNVTLQVSFSESSTKYFKDNKMIEEKYLEDLDADLTLLLDNIGDEYLPEQYR